LKERTALKLSIVSGSKLINEIVFKVVIIYFCNLFDLFMMKIKNLLALLILVELSLLANSQIIADHSVVDKYDEIPQQYIDEVKKMLVDMAGESHSSVYINGTILLENLDPKFQVYGYGYNNIVPDYTEQFLRIGSQYGAGEEQYFTSQAAIDAYKSIITNQNSTGNTFSVMGFVWCWDMTYPNPPGGIIDPVYNVRWAGASSGGADGERRWGLDSGDSILTGNRINMNSYFNAVEQYINHCAINNYPTKIIYTTGPVDNDILNIAGTENGFQREIKHDYIRNFVASNPSRILFDYADILCWNDENAEYLTTWNDGGTLRQHANIHPDNMMDYDASWNIVNQVNDGEHIGKVGALRIAKAMWWMLARIDAVFYARSGGGGN